MRNDLCTLPWCFRWSALFHLNQQILVGRFWCISAVYQPLQNFNVTQLVRPYSSCRLCLYLHVYPLVFVSFQPNALCPPFFNFWDNFAKHVGLWQLWAVGIFLLFSFDLKNEVRFALNLLSIWFRIDFNFNFISVSFLFYFKSTFINVFVYLVLH